MKHTKNLFCVLLASALLDWNYSIAQQVAAITQSPPKEVAYNNPLTRIAAELPVTKIDKQAKAREALPQLLRAVFNTRWNNLEVLLTVDAGWRNDSLSIEYKYYKGNNLLLLDEKFLVEKIYYTVRPDEVDALETEVDEFLFLYLRNSRKLQNIQNLISRPNAAENEISWQSSIGFPIRPENLPLIIQYLKDLRKGE